VATLARQDEYDCAGRRGDPTSSTLSIVLVIVLVLALDLEGGQAKNRPKIEHEHEHEDDWGGRRGDPPLPQLFSRARYRARARPRSLKAAGKNRRKIEYEHEHENDYDSGVTLVGDPSWRLTIRPTR
jgi:hypothetical protein